MKHPIYWLLSLVVIGLIIAGIAFLSEATGHYVEATARTPALIAGITCLGMGSGLLVLGIGIQLFGKRD